jgi:acetyl esterase/lipase
VREQPQWLVAYAVGVVSLFLLTSALTALRPGRRGALEILAFPVGWAAGELAVQAALTEGALVGLLWWWGWPRTRWLSLTVVVVAALVVAGNLVLVAVQFASRVVVRRALADAPVRPLRVGRASEDAYASWWRTLAQIPVHPRSLQISRNVAYGPLRRHRVDVWRLSTTPPGAPVVFFIHGGAWIFGDKVEQGRPMLHEFVARGWIAVAMNYRLAPQYPWPAQIEDVTRALGWVKRSIHSLGGDAERLVVAGASAGGQLAALVALGAQDPSWRPAEYAGLADWSVAGCISLYGVLEMTGDPVIWDGHGAKLRRLLEEHVVHLPLAGHEDVYRAMSPIERITPEAPPFLVIQGGNDTLVDVNVARSFVRRFREVAPAPIYLVELPLTQHAFDLTASPRTSATTRAAVAFAESVVGVGSLRTLN